jgi:hypothetical protein
MNLMSDWFRFHDRALPPGVPNIRSYLQLKILISERHAGSISQYQGLGKVDFNTDVVATLSFSDVRKIRLFGGRRVRKERLVVRGLLSLFSRTIVLSSRTFALAP